MIKGLLIDVHDNKVEVLEIEDTLDEYKRIIKCDWIDIVRVYIGNREYRVVLDDNGALYPDRKISAITPISRWNLYGNLFIVLDNGETLKSLTEDDIKYLKRRVLMVDNKRPILQI